MPIFKKVNKDFFKRWSEDMAYVLGFMYADGNIIKNKRGACFVSLYSADLPLLKKIRTLLGSEHKISPRNNQKDKSYVFQIGSKDIYADLVTLGVRQNKTLRMTVPDMPSSMFPHFLRGYFDGDGNVWVGEIHKERKRRHSAIRVSFTSCSREFLAELSARIHGICGHSGSLIKTKGNYYRLTFSIMGASNLYTIMYNGLQSTLFLPRKRTRFDTYFKKKEMRV